MAFDVNLTRAMAPFAQFMAKRGVSISIARRGENRTHSYVRCHGWLRAINGGTWLRCFFQTSIETLYLLKAGLKKAQQ